MPLKAPVGGTHPFVNEVIRMIGWADSNSARSLQVDLGPSEIGADCPRQLAYKLSGAPEVNDSADYWFAVMGTAVHAWLADSLNRYQIEVLGRGPDNPRFLIEQRVLAVGKDYATPGHTDVYDLDNHRVVDWKLVGKSSLDAAVSGNIKPQYRVQAHTYGLGWSQLGYPVREVCNIYLPRSNFLRNTHIWVEPFDPQIALDALDRLARIDRLRQVVPIGMIPTGECTVWCAHLRPRQPLTDTGCPGHQPKDED